MKHEVTPHHFISDEIYEALSDRQPVVALESTVITHGLPYPENLKLAEEMQQIVLQNGAIPATIALLAGEVSIGLDQGELELLAQASRLHKISTRDIAPAIAGKWSGGTTVAATMYTAYGAGIRVFATGGIGGIHRRLPGQTAVQTWDISADLPQLAKTPMIVVCAGAKAILDLPATLEYLETWAVPVVGYQTGDFPAFYSRQSGFNTSAQANSAAEIVKIAKAHWEIGLESAILVANPPPAESALSNEFVEEAIGQALQEAAAQHIRGQEVTPFLLSRMKDLTEGGSLRANLDLLTNNARLAAQIAKEYQRS